MKILIGAPVHQTKDYAMERWLKNVSELTKQTPADLLMVDNSPGLEYVKKIKSYGDYHVKHIECPQGMGVEEVEERVGMAQEVIRQYVLAHGYDAWFSWECDQIIPTDALDKLIAAMESGNFMMVVHNSWMRNSPEAFNPDMGCTLIKKECLKKNGFLPATGAGYWQGGERWYKERVFRRGGNYLDVYGLISPIYHLDK